MNKRQLIELLSDYPDGMEIRILDTWNCAWNIGCVSDGMCNEDIMARYQQLKKHNYIDDGDWEYWDDSDHCHKFILIERTGT